MPTAEALSRRMTNMSAQTGKMSIKSLLSSKKTVPLLGTVESRLPIGVTNEEVMEDQDIANETYCQTMAGLFSNGSFVFITLSLAMFWFMVCGA